MIFTPSPLAGAWVIDIEARSDVRGFFSRTVCRNEFVEHGIDADFVQQSVSWNPHHGTLRGLHYQAAPYEEDKLVRVTQGSIFDVIVDIRPGSLTCGRWFGIELSAANHRQIYIPKGFAHGFQTLQAETEVLYQMTVAFHPDAPRGIRWSDPMLGINWPRHVASEDRSRLSEADSRLPNWKS